MRSRTVLVGVLLAVLPLAAACGATTVPGSVGPTSAPLTAAPTGPAHPAARGTARAEVTFYGSVDNDPPGSTDIAYPNARHAEAGGTGTYADPVTLASDPRELPPGTEVYDPQIRKYFVMEDDCTECISDWQKHVAHVDLWLAGPPPGLEACEDRLTPPRPVRLDINPPDNLPVDPQPLDLPDGVCR